MIKLMDVRNESKRSKILYEKFDGSDLCAPTFSEEKRRGV